MLTRKRLARRLRLAHPRILENKMPDAIVTVRDVHKFFRRGSEQINVLFGLSLEVPEGEFLALMGPSLPARRRF